MTASSLDPTVDAALTTSGHWLQWLLGAPLKIALILLAAWVLRLVLHRLVDRTAERIGATAAGLGQRRQDRADATAHLMAGGSGDERRSQRARTSASVLNNLATWVIVAVSAVMMLQVAGIPVAPLLASAGVVGVALGIGAQTIVKDVLSGVFMIVEDQFGVGDSVDLGHASGVVEAVGLRVTRIRDTDGTVWYLRNGEIQRVGNRSQGWARAVLDVAVDRTQDLERVGKLLLEVARELDDEPSYSGSLLGSPELWGVEEMSADSVVLRVVVKTKPMQQWRVARELRRRITQRLVKEGIRPVSA